MLSLLKQIDETQPYNDNKNLINVFQPTYLYNLISVLSSCYYLVSTISAFYENWLEVDKLIAMKKGALFGPPCIFIVLTRSLHKNSCTQSKLYNNVNMHQI